MKCVKKTVRHYWKYQYDIWTQPVLASNGTMGGESFACASSNGDAYKAFDSSSSSYCNGLNTNTWLSWYNPIPLKISSIEINSSGNGNMQRSGILQYSDDNTNWTDAVSWSNPSSQRPFSFQCSEQTLHKYWRIYFTLKGTSSSNSDCTNCSITANTRSIIPSTSDDYDYYTDDEVPFLPKISDKFYGINQ